MRTHDAHTHPNQTRPGIPPTWRNANGSRPRNPRVDEMNRRVAAIRAVLADNANYGVAEIMADIGVTLKTAEQYLAMARRPM